MARGSSHGKPRLARCPERAERGVDGRRAPFVSAGAIAGADAIVGLIGLGRAEYRVVVGELPYGAYSCKECASLGVRDPKELTPRFESAMSEQRVQRLLRCKGVFNGSMRDYPIARRRPGCSTRVVQPLLRAALARATSRRSSRCAASRRSPCSTRYHASPFLEALELPQIEELNFPFFYSLGLSFLAVSRSFESLRLPKILEREVTVGVCSRRSTADQGSR